MNLFQSTRQRVATAILDELKRLHGGAAYVEAYVNGREQGYCLWTMKRKAVFSENRSSDDIVVYLGAWGDFSLQGNVPEEECYARATHYGSNEVQRAASDIHKWLTQEAEVWGDDSAIVLHRDS